MNEMQSAFLNNTRELTWDLQPVQCYYDGYDWGWKSVSSDETPLVDNEEFVLTCTMSLKECFYAGYEQGVNDATDHEEEKEDGLESNGEIAP